MLCQRPHPGRAAAGAKPAACSAPRAAARRRCRPHSHQGRYRFDGQTRGGRYSWARYYHPSLSRFISEDALRTWNQTEFYSYADNNPTNLIDPMGLRSTCVCGGLSLWAAVGIGVGGGQSKCRCTNDCGAVSWITVNYVCSCLGLGASVGSGISTGGAAPQTGIAEGLTLSIPFLKRRNLGGGTSPGPGKYSIDVGYGIFGGFCGCFVNVIQ